MTQQLSDAKDGVRSVAAALVSSFSEHFKTACPEDPRRIAERLRAVRLGRVRSQPCKIAVTHYWDRAFEGVERGPTKTLALTLANIFPYLSWMQNPNYTEMGTPVDFLSNYGYAEVLGKDGLFSNDSLALGILLLGPFTAYPEHVHPAAEEYYVAAGDGNWSVEGRPDIAAEAGTIVTIPPGAIHKMWTTGDPLLAIYVWDGEIETRATLVDV